jgi:hypothetical protein
MQFSPAPASTINAEVDSVMPQLGLAYVVDDLAQAWGITRSTPGARFEALEPGRRVSLRIEAYRSFSVVAACKLLD